MAAEQQKLFSIFTSQKHKGECEDDKHEAKKKIIGETQRTLTQHPKQFLAKIFSIFQL